jgi:Fe-S oxidoreductase
MSYPLLKSIIVLFALALTLVVFGRRLYRLLWVRLRLGQPSGGYSQWGERIKSLLIYVAAQLRLFRFLIPGTSHFFIFWGFVLLFPTIVKAIAEGLFAFITPEFKLPLLDSLGPLALLQDLMTAIVAIAVIYGLYLRVIVDPDRYKGSHRKQGVIVLSFILTIMLSLLVMNGIRINLAEDSLANWRPISRAVGSIFAGLNEGVQAVIGEGSYWVHLGVVLLFLTELPLGKHFHIITSLPAVFLRNLQPAGRLPHATEFTDGDGDVKPGVNSVLDFTWRQMLDFYTCTECGRCQEVCPAYSSGMKLSPKMLIMGLRDKLVAQDMARKSAPGPNGGGAGKSNGKETDQRLLGESLVEADVWACTTCYACDQECPLFVEHVTPIVEMRRRMVYEGQMDNMLQEALVNIGRYGNSFGQSDRGRARWTQPVQPRIKDARREAVEFLWFLGDYASYNATLNENTRKTAAVFQAAGLDFGILYESERNSGNDVRRVGEEALFEMLAEQNLAVLAKCDYRVIITTDPHSYNTLKHEYPQNGHHPILHYTELISDLLDKGQLKLTRTLDEQVTYHDPCYLGRYNGVYAAPRRIITATGCKLVEMPRHGDRASCCGAGGGRIWMEEAPIKERPSEARVREAAALDGVGSLIVACPKDVTMFKDAVKTTGLEQRLRVKDLIELVFEAL